MKPPHAAALLALVALGASLASGCAHRRSEQKLAAGIDAHRRGDADAAKVLYTEALDRDARVTGAANNLALIALDRGEEDDAITLLARELAAHPALPVARFNRALLLVRAGRHADAAADLAALTSDDGIPAPLRASARALLAASNARQGLAWERVRDAVGPTPPDAPTDGPVRIGARVVGLAAFDAGRMEDAATWLAGDPAPGVRRRHALALVKLGRADEATALLDGLANERPEDALVAAWVALAAGRPVSGALDDVPSDAWPADGPTAWARARILAAEKARRGDWGEAAATLEEALTAGAPSDLRLDLAVALARSGDLDAARVQARTALAADPSSPRARSLSAALE